MGTSEKRCLFHCLDFELFREWTSTCNVYLGFAKQPFGTVKPKDLVKCEQRSWEDAFQEWSVIQFWVGVAVAIASAIRDFLYLNLIGAVQEAVVRVVLAYVLAHIC